MERTGMDMMTRHNGLAANSRAGGASPTATPQVAPIEMVVLTGRPSLRRFLRLVDRNAVAAHDPAALAEDWKAARDHVRALEESEQYIADDPEIVPLGKEYEPLLVELLHDPTIRHNFNAVPTDVALVELDKLVVYQRHIDASFAQQLETSIGHAPSREQVFRACLPYDHPCPPVTWSRTRQGGYVFVSPSNDMRFLGALPLRADNLIGCTTRGTTVGVVGLAVGFGGNFLNAIHAGRRLILTNGSHRAYALRRLGFTHAPCIVQYAADRDDLELVASEEVRSDPEQYLTHPRPPLLRDYFDPKLSKRLSARRFNRQVTVRFEVDEVSVPAL